MPKFKFPFQDLETIPKLIKDFLQQEIPQFSAYQFTLENALLQAEKKSHNYTLEQRKILVDVLRAQHQHLDLSAKQSQHLDLLLSENTFTVTTGHQLNLFSGPVFFVYKILQTIKTADFLTQNLDKNFVPIFWLATEDHDFEEINHFKTANGFYQVKGNSGGAVGRIIIEDNSFLEEFEKEFKDDVFGTQLILLAKKAYQKGRTFTEATQILVQEIFAEFGLLMIDGDDVLLKNQMQNIFKEELVNHTTHHFSQENVKFLTEKYGKVQVNPREINLFYLSDTRNRIEFDGEQFQIVDKNLTFTLEELAEDWSKISPNALLRPVFQEKVLPNIAYIGGNAEIMYWLEMPKVFEKFGVEFPLLVPRNSMLFLRKKTLDKIEKSGVALQDFLGDFQKFLNQKLLKESEMNADLESREQLLKENFEIDFEDLAKAMNHKTKAIIINSPHNPSGKVWKEEDFNRLSDLVKDTDVIVISDEVYDVLTYDNHQFYSAFHHPKLREQCFSVFSFGKMFHVTGWKVGYILASEELSAAYRRIHQYLSFSVNSPAQYALAKYLEIFDVEENRTLMQQKRDFFIEQFNDLPFTLQQKAEAGYFQILGYEDISDLNDKDFSVWMTEKGKVASIPVSAFYKNSTTTNSVRFCFSKKEETIAEAAKNLRSFF